MAQAIPFDQPILIVHYSEKRDCRYLGRIEGHFSKSAEAQDKTEYYMALAKSAESNTAIFSDDPQAEEKLEDKINRLKDRQGMMKKANALVRKDDREGLLDTGFGEAQAHMLLIREGDIIHRKGFASWELSSNNANIGRCEECLKKLQDQAKDETSEFDDCLWASPNHIPFLDVVCRRGLVVCSGNILMHLFDVAMECFGTHMAHHSHQTVDVAAGP